ncbi:MAG TPA: glycosyltransferase family 39 protein [Acidimicrobiales bacterium]|jgi:hypothetical protein|nr:glycosyltransferase family 39 protein [Acidimicrobiales bacterium]
MTTMVAPPEAGLAPAPPTETTSTRGPSRFVWLVVAALVVGLALRIAIGLTDDSPATDEAAYLGSGISLIEGDGYQRDGRPELHFPPFVPFVLGLASRAFADPHVGTVVVTCLASTAVIVPLALLGRRIGGPAAGAATAWVAALGPALSTTLVNRGAGSEAIYTLLVVVAVWLVVAAADRQGRARSWRVVGAGTLVGCAYLSRPEGLILALPLGLAVLAIAARAAHGHGGWWRTFGPRTLRLPVAFAVPIVACIVPYSLYLHEHTGEWRLSGKGQGVALERWQSLAGGDREARDSVVYALDETGLEFAATERNHVLSAVSEDPRNYIGIVRTNAGKLVDSVVGQVGKEQVLSWLLLPLPLWLLAIAGAWQHRRSGTVRLLLAVGALPVATALAFFVQFRYMIVAVALATPLIGAGAALVTARWRRPVLAAMVALLLLSSVQGFYSTGSGWWHPPENTDERRAGEWLAANIGPDDRVITRSMVVEHYADRPTMAMPYADLDDIVRYARHHGAQYLVLDRNTARLRPQLAPLRRKDDVPGLRPVHEVQVEGRTAAIFALEPAPPKDRPMGAPLGFKIDELD